MSLSLRNLECKCRQQLWWCLSAAICHFFSVPPSNSLQRIQFSISSQMMCAYVVVVFLTTFFPFHYHSFILSCSMLALSLVQSVVDVVLLLLLFYCRLRFCLLHKWINYVLRAQTQTHRFFPVVVLIHSFDFLASWIPYVCVCVWCNAFASNIGCYVEKYECGSRGSQPVSHPMFRCSSEWNYWNS